MVHQTNGNTGKETDNNFKLYPNPNNGSMQIENNLPENTNFSLIIYDIAGRMLKNSSLVANNKIITINAEELNAGVYYYKIKIGNRTIKSERLVIVK